MRYDELVANPRNSVRRIMNAVGHEVDLFHISGQDIVVNPQHIVSGNPNKMELGTITLREVKQKLPLVTQAITVLMTWPLYIYLGIKSGK